MKKKQNYYRTKTTSILTSLVLLCVSCSNCQFIDNRAGEIRVLSRKHIDTIGHFPSIIKGKIVCKSHALDSDSVSVILMNSGVIEKMKFYRAFEIKLFPCFSGTDIYFHLGKLRKAIYDLQAENKEEITIEVVFDISKEVLK